MLKIDIHTHILPENWPDLKERYGYGGFVQLEHHGPGCAQMLKDGKCFREVEANCWDPSTRLRDCDATGVDVYLDAIDAVQWVVLGLAVVQIAMVALMPRHRIAPDEELVAIEPEMALLPELGTDRA